MKRQIKFRAWDGSNHCMVNSDHCILFDGKVQMIQDYRLMDPYLDFIPLQFTGLLDKNGVEIYEGDICQNGTRVELIESIEDLYFDELMEGFVKEGQVIGNVYQHPELLKELN